MKMRILFYIAVFIFSISSLQAQKNSTRPSIQGPPGYKVNSYSGNLYYERQDFLIESIGPKLNFQFAYNSSKRTMNRGYGYGWTFNFNILHYEEDGFTIVEKSDGKKIKFSPVNGSFQAEKGVFDKLREYESGKLELRMKDGTRYLFEDSQHKRVTQILDRCDNALMLSYTDSLVTTITDAVGRAINLNWANGRLIEIKHDLVDSTRTYQYSYDAEGNLTRYTNPLGYTQEYTYDASHKLIRVIDENSTPTKVSYHASGGVKGISSCDQSFTISYNPRANRTYLVETIGEERHVTTYQFDEDGRISEKQGNCCGYNTKYAYDDNNNISKKIDGNDNEQLLTYDDMGNISSNTDPFGKLEKFIYDPIFNKVLSKTDRLGNTTTYEYDSKGNLTKTAYPLNIVEQWTYNDKGKLLAYTDPRNNTTKHKYDEFGYLIQKIYADSTSKKFTYDKTGNRLTSTDGNGNTTQFKYDHLNRVSEIIDPLGNSIKHIYDPIGNLIELIDANGGSTQMEYDGLGQLIAETSPMGKTFSYKYNARGDVIETLSLIHI